MKKQEIKHLFIESGLIVFSVLFALLVDRLADEYRDNQQKQYALARIHQELTANQALVRDVIDRHQLALANLTRASSNPRDSLRLFMEKQAYIDYRLLAKGQSLYPRFPASTAWQAAQATGIVSQIEYITVEACTEVYAQQDIIVGGTLSKILDDLFEVNDTPVAKRLTRLQLEFGEIIAQEQTLLNLLQPAIQKTAP